MEPPGRLVRAPARARRISATPVHRLGASANPPSEDRPLCSTPGHPHARSVPRDRESLGTPQGPPAPACRPPAGPLYPKSGSVLTAPDDGLQRLRDGFSHPVGTVPRLYVTHLRCPR